MTVFPPFSFVCGQCNVNGMGNRLVSVSKSSDWPVGDRDGSARSRQCCVIGWFEALTHSRKWFDVTGCGVMGLCHIRGLYLSTSTSGLVSHRLLTLLVRP